MIIKMSLSSNIDTLAKRFIPYFDDYCNNLVDINDNRFIQFNKISYNSELKLKNINRNHCLVYKYSSKEVTHDNVYVLLSDLKVLFGYNENGVQVYFDNYFNVSLSIKDKIDIYIERNTESFPLICFYSGKFNFKGSLFDYDLNKNLINNIIIILSKYQDNNSNFDENLMIPLKNLLNDYFDNNNIPQFTKSYSNIREYMCTYRYLNYKLTKLKEFYSIILGNYDNKSLSKKVIDLQRVIDDLKDIQVKKSRQNKDLEKIILDKDVEIKSSKKVLDKNKTFLNEFKKNLEKSHDLILRLENENKYNKLLNFRLKFLMVLLITILSLVMYIVFVETPHVYHMYYHKSKVLSNDILNISFIFFNSSYHYLGDMFSDLNNVTISHYLDNPDHFDM